jgi:hypothetical protein
MDEYPYGLSSTFFWDLHTRKILKRTETNMDFEVEAYGRSAGMFPFNIGNFAV